MTYLYTTSIFRLLLLMLVLMSAPILAAAQTIDVAFEATPLFLDADVKPGDSTDRTVTVTNTGDTAEELYVAVENTFTTGLDKVMKLRVTNGQATYFDGTFAEFFAQTPLALLNITPGSTQTYTFTAALDAAVGNEYQETQLGFDLVMGFQGGVSVTDTPSGGGGGARMVALVLSSEDVTVSGSNATITWNTNLGATSYVVCGAGDNGPYTLSEGAPLFGYDFAIPEVSSNLTSHSLTQSGLEPDTYECRPASRVARSDVFSVGQPLVFTIATPAGLVAGETLSRPTPVPFLASQPTGSVLGYGNKGTMGAPTYDEWRAELDREQAEQLELEELNAVATDTATTSPATATTDRATDNWLDRQREDFNWWILVFLCALLAGFGWTYRRAGR